MKKRILSLALALTIALSCAPFAGAAVSSSDAQTYYQLCEKNPHKTPYLVDFDGDGRDELLLIWDTDQYYNKLGKTYYEVWSSSKKLVSSSAEYQYLGIYTNKNNPSKKYLVDELEVVGDLYRTTYTVSSGYWAKSEDFTVYGSIVMAPVEFLINGKSVDEDTFDSRCYAYKFLLTLNPYSSDNYNVRATTMSQLLNSIDYSLPLNDVLSTLSSREKKNLFDRLLTNTVEASNFSMDYQKASDADLLHVFIEMNLVSHFPFEEYGATFAPHTYNYPYRVFSKAEFTRLTNELFGRTINYSAITRNSPPSGYDVCSFFYNNKVHIPIPEAGDLYSERVIPKHLYSIGGNIYCATFDFEQPDWELDWDWSLVGIHSAVVKKNANNTWTLLRLYPNGYVPAVSELESYVQPSSWAKAEVEAADKAGLIPDLTGDPGWQDASTRLQFCQLAVQLAETALGKTLPAAPANTFTDCSDLAVRKAYAAGIVNGMTETTFSPNGTLTREQLATMLWRAVNYIQTQSGEQTLIGGGSLTGYTDAGSVSSYAKDAVAALNKHGIMKGTSDTALSPKGSCTVEQSVLLSYRTFLKLN